MAKFFNGMVKVNITYQKTILVTEERLISKEDYDKLLNETNCETFFKLEEWFTEDEEDYIKETICIDGVSY